MHAHTRGRADAARSQEIITTTAVVAFPVEVRNWPIFVRDWPGSARTNNLLEKQDL